MGKLASRRMSSTFLRIDEPSRDVTPDPPKSAPINYENDRNVVVSRPIDINRKEKNYVASGSGATSSSLSHMSDASVALLSNLKHSSSGTAGRIGRAGKGFFGKITKNGTTHDRDAFNDDNYVCTVINMPLIAQTRRTRISPQLESSRDKTEFWMPALPYRCIE